MATDVNAAGRKLMAEVMAAAKRSVERWLKAESLCKSENPAEVLAIWQKLSGIPIEEGHSLVLLGVPAKLAIEAQVIVPMIKGIEAEKSDPATERFRVFETATAAECYSVRTEGKSEVVTMGENLSVNESAFTKITESSDFAWTPQYLAHMFPNSNLDYVKWIMNTGAKRTKVQA